MRAHQHGPARADDDAAARPASEPGARPLGSVLVAASDPDMRLYLRLGLDDLAVEVLEAADGLEALQRLAGRRVALVVADDRMPRLDGRELARVLAGRGVALLLLAGEEAEGPPEAGVSAVLVKPFDRRQLRHGVGEALASREGIDEGTKDSATRARAGRGLRGGSVATSRRFCKE